MSARKTKILSLAIAVSILCATTSALGAKSDTDFKSAPGVRPAAMGGAFVAIADDVNSIYYNPAGLVTLTKKQVQVTHTDLYGLGIDYNYLAYAQQKFGIAWSHMSASEFLLGGGDYNEDELIFAGAYQMDPQTSIGMNFKILKSQYTAPGSVAQGSSAQSVSDEGYSIDVGVLHKVDNFTTVGARAKNLYGNRKVVNSSYNATEDTFKPQLSVGFSRRTSSDFMFTIELDGVGKETRVHVGAEKKMQEQLLIRAGLDDDILTAGIGFSQNDWAFDYSYKNAMSTGLNETQRFGASVKF